MKTSFAVIITGLCISTPLFAQDSGKPKASQGTRIAVVNIGVVMNDYSGTRSFKTMLDERLLPYIEKIQKLKDQNAIWRTWRPCESMSCTNYKKRSW